MKIILFNLGKFTKLYIFVVECVTVLSDQSFLNDDNDDDDMHAYQKYFEQF